MTIHMPTGGSLPAMTEPVARDLRAGRAGRSAYRATMTARSGSAAGAHAPVMPRGADPAAMIAALEVGNAASSAGLAASAGHGPERPRELVWMEN